MRTFTLIEEEEGEETLAEAGDQDEDALFKRVFDSIRNVIICAALAIAGAGVIKWRADLQFLGPTINAAIGILLILTALLLCIWNMVNGCKVILAPAKGTTKVGLYILGSFVYGFLGFALLQTWAMVQAKPLHMAASDITVARTQHNPASLTLTLDCSLDPEVACIKSVVLVPHVTEVTDKENQEDMPGSSIASSFIEGYIPWSNTEASPDALDHQIAVNSDLRLTQRAY
jgi:hypothetical protein